MVRENSGNAGWSFLVFPVIDMAATGSVIKALREQNGYLVQDVQEYFGFEQPQAIYKWQRGETLPTVDNLYALSTLLGEPIKDILVPTGYTVFSRFGGHNQNRSERVKLARKRREDKKQDRGGDSRM
jgi:transcriptional regulator with XRE-family HTH domain